MVPPYPYQLFNEIRGAEEVERKTFNVQNQHQYGPNIDITMNKVGEGLKDMGRVKVVDPSNIPIEVWRCLV